MKVFLSYHSNDRSWATGEGTGSAGRLIGLIRSEIQRAGSELSMSPLSQNPGSAIHPKLEEAELVIVLVSQSYVISPSEDTVFVRRAIDKKLKSSILILVSQVDWESSHLARWFSKGKLFPSMGSPLDRMSETELGNALEQLAGGFRDFLPAAPVGGSATAKVTADSGSHAVKKGTFLARLLIPIVIVLILALGIAGVLVAPSLTKGSGGGSAATINTVPITAKIASPAPEPIRTPFPPNASTPTPTPVAPKVDQNPKAKIVPLY